MWWRNGREEETKWFVTGERTEDEKAVRNKLIWVAYTPPRAI